MKSFEDRYFLARFDVIQRLVPRLEAKGIAHHHAIECAGLLVKFAAIARPHWVGGIRVPSVIRTAVLEGGSH